MGNRLAESIDILEAAQKLMQLSDEDLNNKDGDGDVTGKMIRKRIISGEEVDQMPSDINIKENDIEVIAGPKKMKKYRSLVNIYRVTRPINAGKWKRDKGEDLSFNQ